MNKLYSDAVKELKAEGRDDQTAKAFLLEAGIIRAIAEAGKKAEAANIPISTFQLSLMEVIAAHFAALVQAGSKDKNARVDVSIAICEMMQHIMKDKMLHAILGD